MSQYPSDYFSQHYVDQNYTQQVPNQTNSTLEEYSPSRLHSRDSSSMSMRSSPNRGSRRRAYSNPTLRRTPSPPSTAPPFSVSRTTRIRFVDASYQPPERRSSATSVTSSGGTAGGGGGGWSPRRRRTISETQLEKLLEVFEQVDTPSIEVRERLSAELDMTPREIQVWFQNRRAKVKRQRESAGTGELGGPEVRAREDSSSSTHALPQYNDPFGRTAPENSHSTWSLPFSPPFSFRQASLDSAPASPASRNGHLHSPRQAPQSNSPSLESETPRYRKIFGHRRISLPTNVFFPITSPSPPHSDYSTASSNSTCFFNRILPTPISSLGSNSPLNSFDRLSICSSSSHSQTERDPFFSHLPASTNHREQEHSEPIQLAPIIESIPTNVFTSRPDNSKQPSHVAHPRSRISIEDLLNPTFPPLTRRSSTSF